MRFGLSEDQRLLSQSIRKWLAEGVDESLVKATRTDLTAAAEFGSSAAQMGIPSVMAPLPVGGSGMGLLESILIAERLGEFAAPMNLQAAVMASCALTDTPCEGHLKAVAQGQGWIGVGAVTSARDNGSLSYANGVLNGKVLMVSDAPKPMSAECVGWLVGSAECGWFFLKAAVSGLETKEMTTIDNSRQLGEMTLSDVKAERVTESGPDFDRVLDAGRLILAADSFGACEKMIQSAVQYSGERQQFGRYIGSFQAIKHMCAEMAAALEPTRSLLWYAAYAWDNKAADARVHTLQAKAHISEVALDVSRKSIEVHGGIGFTEEFGLHRWFKRIGLNRQWLGSPQRLRAEVATIFDWVSEA